MIPPEARNAIRAWLEEDTTVKLTAGEAKAHQRLLREFFLEHIAGERELKAFVVWERGDWTAA